MNPEVTYTQNPKPIPANPILNTHIQSTIIKTQPKNNSGNPFAGLKWYECIICGLPLFLLAAGGAIGGGIGTLAFFANIKIWQSGKSKAIKVLSVLGILLGAIVADLILAGLFQSLIGRIGK